jgi:DNA-binding NarL/FixJ family response regulator
MHFAPHLLLRADAAAASPAAALLRAGGYIVSRVDDDALAEQLAGAAHVDGVVVELPALASIQFGRKLAARYGEGTVLLLSITPAVQTVQRAVPSALAMTPRDVADDLISTIDLALAARQRSAAS